MLVAKGLITMRQLPIHGNFVSRLHALVDATYLLEQGDFNEIQSQFLKLIFNNDIRFCLHDLDQSMSSLAGSQKILI